MNNKFDELAKGLAQSVTRRQALKRFGAGLAGMALACFGLTGSAQANPNSDCGCVSDTDCKGKNVCFNGYCVPNECAGGLPCCTTKPHCGTLLPPCNPNYAQCESLCHFTLGC